MEILAISAHPDDELFGGGLLARYAAEGHAVSLCCTTRGEGGEVGEPPVGPKERLGEYRMAEQRCAAVALGLRDVVFLDFVDPHMEIDGIALPIEVPFETFQAAVESVLQRLRPDVVITHGSNGEYGHPQHVYTHRVVFAAIAALAPAWQPRELWTWCASYPNSPDTRLLNQDDPADLVLDLTDTPWLAAKQAAMRCHRSQQAMFLRNSGKADLDATVRRVESFHRWPLPLPASAIRHEKPDPLDMRRREKWAEATG